MHVKAILDRKEDFDAAGCKIVIVCHGDADGALRWMDDMEYMPLPLFIDGKRMLYKAIGQRPSLTKSWSMKSLIDMANWKKKNANVDLGYWNRPLDRYQLGGNIVLNKDQRVTFVYAKDEAVFRPPVQDLLDAIDRELPPPPIESECMIGMEPSEIEIEKT